MGESRVTTHWQRATTSEEDAKMWQYNKSGAGGIATEALWQAFWQKRRPAEL
ncbi:hypothetical protein AXF42_Ash020312 [Apostasia shenzhenica]|uniref:Uncharacterized protein n=1 Tax=Apostasia shenzhenica TaxID=1088818 RepID=A0A2H9ZT00_9ASPA|nr:hypothetical protein AXF42_Ash020312 [Apostasia shenzhenica]